VIVGIASVAGERGRQSNYLYGSAKAGFRAYLSGLRNRMHRESVHVVTVQPGFVYTKMTENLNLPKMLTATPDEVAETVYSAVYKRKNVVYVKWFWRWIMVVIKSIPESVFKKLKL
jgi:short-subunit dehydrogenase